MVGVGTIGARVVRHLSEQTGQRCDNSSETPLPPLTGSSHPKNIQDTPLPDALISLSLIFVSAENAQTFSLESEELSTTARQVGGFCEWVIEIGFRAVAIAGFSEAETKRIKARVVLLG